MDTNDLEAALGLPFESPAVQHLANEFGLKAVPSAKKDDPDAYLVANPLGVGLKFVDNDYIERKSVVRYGNAPMIFVAATLYSGRQSNDPSKRKFGGALPAGTTFDDSVESLVRKLGDPTSIYEDEGVIYTRVWHRGPSRIAFKYNAAGILQFVQVNWDVYMKRMTED